MVDESAFFDDSGEDGNNEGNGYEEYFEEVPNQDVLCVN